MWGENCRGSCVMGPPNVSRNCRGSCVMGATICGEKLQRLLCHGGPHMWGGNCRAPVSWGPPYVGTVEASVTWGPMGDLLGKLRLL